MKTRSLFFLVLAVLLAGFAPVAVSAADTSPALTKFDLDFPGGTPGELVAAIQKATRKPLNAVIQSEDAATKLPAFKVSGVDVQQLFQALLTGSQRSGLAGGRLITSFAGFRTAGMPSDDAIWYFVAESGLSLPKTSRFYLLTPYLEHGLTVDDITTAIQTAWKLSGGSPAPVLNFHRETKLLIGVGWEWQLSTIDDVLHALDPVKTPAKTTEAIAEKKPTS